MTRTPESARHRSPIELTERQLRTVHGGCGEECVCCYAPGDCYVEMCYCIDCCCENGGGTDCMDMPSSGCSM
jgi:hypothetical protein